MVFYGKHTINYRHKGDDKRICVKVEIKQRKEFKDPPQPIWCAEATVNGRPVNRPDLVYCVNAQYMAEEIAEDRLNELRKEYGRSIRVKK